MWVCMHSIWRYQYTPCLGHSEGFSPPLLDWDYPVKRNKKNRIQKTNKDIDDDAVEDRFEALGYSDWCMGVEIPLLSLAISKLPKAFGY